METLTTNYGIPAMVDALLLSDTEKTFQYDDDLPSLPIPPLKQTLDKYLQSVKPFLTNEEYKTTEKLVQEFGAGQGQELNTKLSERAKYMRNWLERWWEDYAYLEFRFPSALLMNMAGPGPYVRDVWPAQPGTQLERSAMLLHLMTSFWKILRQERLRPQLDGKGKPLCMNQFRSVYSTCRVPGINMDRIEKYFKTESQGPAPSNIIVTCRGHIFNISSVDSNEEVLTPPEFLAQLRTIRELSDRLPYGQSIGNLTTDERTEWAKMRSRLVARNPQNYANLLKIQESIILLDLADENPVNDSQLAWLGLGGNADNKFFDKGFSLSGFQNGLFCSSCEHSPFDAMVLVISTHYIHLKLKEMGGKWTGSNAVRKLPAPDELVFDLDETLTQRITLNRQKFKQLCARVEVEAELFRDYGKDYLKSAKVHPDAHVQLSLQYTYYRMYRKPAPTYETATTRRFSHGRTETMRSCSTEAVDWCQAMMDSSISSETRLQKYLRAVDRHNQLMSEAQAMNGCDRHLFGLYTVARLEGLPPPAIFTDPAYFKSGGGGNFVLSTSSIGYTSVYGGVSPMCKDGYGCFYRMGPNEIGTFLSAWTADKATSTKEFTRQFHESLREIRVLLDQRTQMARL